MTIDELKELMETGEEFEISNSPYKFQIKGNILWAKDEQGWHWSFVKMNDLFESTIIRKPWKPKVGEDYFLWYNNVISKEFYIAEATNVANYEDLLNIAFGNCFRTKEECESHTEIRDKLTEMRKECI